MEIIKEFKWAVGLIAAILAFYIFNQELGVKAAEMSWANIYQMLTLVPPIFILVGLLDVWVPKETMVKYMGQESGLKGLIIAFIIGTASAGPLYGAFPIAALLLKKGARLAYVIFFLGIWSSTKLPIVMFEIASLGLKFTVLHIGLSVPAFILISFLIEKLVSEQSLNEVRTKAASF